MKMHSMYLYGEVENAYITFLGEVQSGQGRDGAGKGMGNGMKWNEVE